MEDSTFEESVEAVMRAIDEDFDNEDLLILIEAVKRTVAKRKEQANKLEDL